MATAIKLSNINQLRWNPTELIRGMAERFGL
jgi:hypothetical protein